MSDLRKRLADIPAGPVAETGQVERILGGYWDDLDGSSDGGMEGYKLLGRMEEVVWKPPVLTFAIERHGATVNGSTRAELQHWSVNVDEETAILTKSTHRQLWGMAPRMGRKEMRALAEEIASIIVERRRDERVCHRKDGGARVVFTRVFPGTFKQTRRDRGRRLSRELAEILGEKGWEKTGYNGNAFRPRQPAVLSA